jgi:CRP-like cAMP-binding protein
VREDPEQKASPAIVRVSQSETVAPMQERPSPDGRSTSPRVWRDGDDPRLRNKILAAVPDGELRRLRSELTLMSLAAGQVIYEPDEPIHHVYFPIDAVISVISVLSDGATVEVATVGNEGMAGVAAFLGATSMPYRSLSQVPGTVARLPVAVLRELTGGAPALADRLRRYTQGLLNQIAQTAACNRLHTVDERCAR